MITFIDNPNMLIKDFTELIEVSQSKAFITVCSEIQKAEIQTLKAYSGDLGQLKKEYVNRNLENEANLVWCIENLVNTIKYELEMLVHIKEDRMGEAWGNLVNAQTTFASVVRNYPFDTDHLNGYVNRLSCYEQLLFPKLLFNSAGGIIKKSKCSICNEDYGKCEHIKGKLYYGEMCYRIITEFDLEEASFVENPANKHCRVLSIENEGKMIDILTLREVNSHSSNHHTDDCQNFKL